MKRDVRSGTEIKRHTISFADQAQGGRSSTMEGCLLATCPDQVEAGVTFEVMFECELIETNNAGGTFRASFDSGAA